MKRKGGYLLHKIADEYYILPYGQRIVDHRRSVRINEAGAFLWNHIEQECTREKLLTEFAGHYQAEPQEIPILEKDMDLFLKHLSIQGMLEDEEKLPSPGKNICRYLQIGGLTLELNGPQEVFAEEFDAFSCEKVMEVHQKIYVRYGEPFEHRNGRMVLRSRQVIICDMGKEYLLLFPETRYLLEAHLEKTGERAAYFIRSVSDRKGIAEELFHGIRLAYLYLAQKRGRFAIHSASVLYRNQAWLFAAPSGEGKSTHTNMWKQEFQTPILNGDLNLLALEEGKPVVYGMPWCGTSGISDTETRRLGGIVLLTQAKEDRCIPLSEDEKQLLVMKRLVSPSWTDEMMLMNLRFVEQLARNASVYHLHCTKNSSAVYVIKKQIDNE